MPLTPATAGDRIAVMDNRWDPYRNYIQEYIKRDTSLLFQRFNYFLVMTSFLIIAFVTIISSNRFAVDFYNSYYWVAQTIGIVGFLLSYFFSIVNFLNSRLIHDMGLFLRRVNRSQTIHRLPSFADHVSNSLVRKYRFDYKYFWDVYRYTVAFIARTNLDSRSVKRGSADYMDLAPHTWLAPMFIAYVWIVVYSIIFLDPRWLLPSVVAFVSFIVGLRIRTHYRMNKEDRPTTH